MFKGYEKLVTFLAQAAFMVWVIYFLVRALLLADAGSTKYDPRCFAAQKAMQDIIRGLDNG